MTEEPLVTSSEGTRLAEPPEVSVVVPVLNEVRAIERFVAAVDGTFPAAGVSSYEYVFVDDGSTDGTWTLLSELAAHRADVRVIRLSRNFGKEAALAAGLTAASGRAHIPMDVDLQDPPAVAADMVALWRAGAPVVLARRRRRQESLAKRMTARIFYSLAARGADVQIPAQVGDFRVMDHLVTQQFLSLGERSRFNKGLFALVSPPGSASVEFDRPVGREGGARQGWWTLTKLGIDGLVSFTTWPLRLISLLGFTLMLLSFVGTVLSIVLRQIGVLEVPGQTTVIVMVLFLAGFQALSTGVLGEYVARILIEVKRRPLYLVESSRGFPPNDGPLPSSEEIGA